MTESICINMCLQTIPVSGRPDASPITERVLWQRGDQVIVINLDDDHALPERRSRKEVERGLARGWIKRVADDRYTGFHRAEQDIPESHRRRRDQAWQWIAPLLALAEDIFDASVRGPHIARREQETGVHRKYLYRHLRHYWQRGQMKNAVLPNYERCGGPGQRRNAKPVKLGRKSRVEKATQRVIGIAVTNDVETIFKRALRRFHYTKQLSLRETYQRMLETDYNRGYEWRRGALAPCIAPPHERPTFRQFEFWQHKYRDHHAQAHLQAREGEHRFNLHHRPLLGSARGTVYGPGAVFQVDAAIANVYLVSTFDRTHIIGQPTLYMVMDVFTTMIVGLAVTLEPPCWLGAMLAMENTLTDKVPYCKQFGIEIDPSEWPCCHMAHAILADRGEFEGYNANQLVSAFGVEMINTPPYRPDWKPIVERNFKLQNDTLIHQLPGAVAQLRQRGDPDHRLNACLTLYEFQRLLIFSALHHNHEHRLTRYQLEPDMLVDGVEPYPVDLWTWGVQARTGLLTTWPEQAVRLNLLPSSQATVTASGIQYGGLHYTYARAVQEGWFSQARARKTWRVPVAYDPRLVNQIYLRSADGRRIERCDLLPVDARFRDWHWHDVQQYLELHKLNTALAEPRQRQALAQLHAHMDAVVEDAIVEQAQPITHATTQERRPAKTVRAKHIRAHRADESSAERRKAARKLAGETATTAAVPKTTSRAGYVATPDMLEELRRWRGETGGEAGGS